jgi:hypothetical protein
MRESDVKNDGKLDTIGLIADLVARAPTKLGRTALTKCLFLLKVVKHVPLPYSFGLYTIRPLRQHCAR